MQNLLNRKSFRRETFDRRWLEGPSNNQVTKVEETWRFVDFFYLCYHTFFFSLISIMAWLWNSVMRFLSITTCKIDKRWATYNCFFFCQKHSLSVHFFRTNFSSLSNVSGYWLVKNYHSFFFLVAGLKYHEWCECPIHFLIQKQKTFDLPGIFFIIIISILDKQVKLVVFAVSYI